MAPLVSDWAPLPPDESDEFNSDVFSCATAREVRSRLSGIVINTIQKAFRRAFI